MVTRAAAENVSASFGGRTVGNAAVVFLEQPADTVFPPFDGSMQEAVDNVVTMGKVSP